MRLLRRILRWIGIVVAGLVALVLLYFGLALLPRFRLWLAQPPTDARIVAKALWWIGTDRDVIARLEAEPAPLMALVLNPGSPACSAARKLIGRVSPHQLSASQLAELAGVLLQCNEGERFGILRVLRSNREPGHMALASCLAASSTLPADLRIDIINHLIINDFDSSYAPTIHRRLLEIGADASVALENRQAAIEALGRSGKSAEPLIPLIEALGVADPAALGGPAAIAVSRIRNTPDLQRLRADLELGRRLHYLSSVIREIGDLGPAANAIGPEILSELKPLGDDNGAVAAITLARIGYSEAIPDLRGALHCANDWRLVAGAAEALGRLQAKDAAPELAQIATNHWDSLVREVARNAIEAFAGNHEYRNPMQGIDCLEYDRLQIHRQQRAYAEGWRPSAEAIASAETADRWRKLGEFWVRLISPLVTSISYRRQRDGLIGTAPWNLLPRHRLRFAGGSLLGYHWDESEFGAVLIFVSKSGAAHAFPTAHVTQLVPWNDGVIALTTAAMVGDSTLYLVRAGPDGIPTVTRFMRMPDMTEHCTVEASGALNFHGYLRLTTDGRLETITTAQAVLGH